VRRAAWIATGVAVLAIAAACTEVGTDPSVPVAIEVDPPLLPAIAVGDTLRDTLGVVAPVVARALNSSNDVIPDAPITFLALPNDSILTVDAETGIVVGNVVGLADVVAQVAGLQSVRVPVRVTNRPDTVFTDSVLVDSVLYGIGADTARRLVVSVMERDTVGGRDTLIAVPFWRVRYTITTPADLAENTDTTRVYIANDANRLSRVDTTDTNGGASRRLRFPLAVVSDTARRTFVTEVVVLGADGTPLPGSPIVFTTVIRPR
jgi:hypothetical protein